MAASRGGRPMAERFRGRAASRAAALASVDLSTQVGSVALRSPILAASGTAGHGDELARYVDLSTIGAVVVKSLCADPWPGNPPPRVHETSGGMLNSVGLQGPGVQAWRDEELPSVVGTGATVVASIWGTEVADYERAAAMLVGCKGIVAIEVNLSCPNHHSRGQMFAHAPETTTEAMAAVVSAGTGLPLWAKLSPNVTNLVEIAEAAAESGAEAVTLVNTLMGMVIDLEGRTPILGGRGGGLSGPAIHPVAVRAVYDVHAALPELPILGVGGVARGIDAVEFLMAGASAVQVGTASFAEPAAIGRIQRELGEWCAEHGISAVTELTGVGHA
jgi:dihydroorotate dehydrogenase (NAD+) catalytic subunit